MGQAVAVRVDNKCRLTIPKAIRERLAVKPGDMVFVKQKGKVASFAKAENPFDALAEHALREHKAGRTRDIREIAAEWGVGLGLEA